MRRLTPHGRERLAKMVLGGQTPQAASEAAGVCPRTGRKWRDRFDGRPGRIRIAARGSIGCVSRRAGGDRAHRKPAPQRMPGKEIATTVGVSPATVSHVLKRLGLSKLSALEPASKPRRYEREQPRDDPHRHQKARQVQSDRPPHHRRPQGPEQQPRRRLGVPHVCIDDASRVAFSKIMKTERRALCRDLPQGCRRLLQKPRHHRAARHDRQRLCYRSKACRQGLPAPQLKHIRTKPYMPRTNGKAERFIETIATRMGLCPRLSELQTTRPRAALCIHRYNWHRPHASMGAKPPMSKLG